MALLLQLLLLPLLAAVDAARLKVDANLEQALAVSPLPSPPPSPPLDGSHAEEIIHAAIYYHPHDEEGVQLHLFDAIDSWTGVSIDQPLQIDEEILVRFKNHFFLALFKILVHTGKTFDLPRSLEVKKGTVTNPKTITEASSANEECSIVFIPPRGDGPSPPRGIKSPIGPIHWIEKYSLDLVIHLTEHSDLGATGYRFALYVKEKGHGDVFELEGALSGVAQEENGYFKSENSQCTRWNMFVAAMHDPERKARFPQHLRRIDGVKGATQIHFKAAIYESSIKRASTVPLNTPSGTGWSIFGGASKGKEDKMDKLGIQMHEIKKTQLPNDDKGTKVEQEIYWKLLE